MPTRRAPQPTHHPRHHAGRRRGIAAGGITILALALGLSWGVALGAPKEGDDVARARLERGKSLFTTAFAEGAKSCQSCHASGANKLTMNRLNAYPKYDRPMRAFVSAQQKINQMIATKSGGSELPLGSDDLNALEAYIKSLR